MTKRPEDLGSNQNSGKMPDMVMLLRIPALGRIQVDRAWLAHQEREECSLETKGNV